jgi:hypothetical protein
MRLRALLFLAAAAPALAQFTIVTDSVLPLATLGEPYPPITIETSGASGPVTWSFVGQPSPPDGFVIGRSAQDPKNGTFCFGASTGGTSAPVCTGTVQGSIPLTYLFRVRAQSGTETAEKQFSLEIQNALRITTLEVPEVGAGQPYSQQLIAAGGVGAYTWQIIDGSLPPGITLDSSGLLSGTAPSNAAAYFFKVEVANSGSTAARWFVINVSGSLQITTQSLPLTVLNQAMTPFQLQAAGGQNYGWSVPFGWTLPPGLVLSSAGVLSGTPSAAGSYRFVIQMNSATQTEPVAKYFTLHVTLGALSIVQADLPVAAVNALYQTTVTASGGLPPYNWAFDTAATQGLQINAETGVISGTPPTVGSFPLPVAVTDVTGNRVVKNFTLAVSGPLTITTTSLPDATKGVAYSQMLTAGGGLPPYTWSISSGTLPDGLALNASTGAVSGTPAADGQFSFQIRVTDFALNTTTRQLSLNVVRAVMIVTSSLPDGVAGAPYVQGLQADTQSVTWSIVTGSGTLPPGLQLNTVTGEISGIPTTPGVFNFIVQASDGVSQPGTRALSIAIYAPLLIPTTSLPGGNKGVAYSQTLTAVGGKAPLVWSLSSGSVLPPGLTLSSAGLISGTPEVAGTFQFQVTVLDAGTQAAQATLSITIIDALTITTGDLSGTAGTAFSQTLAAAGGTAPYTWSVTSGALPGGLQLNASTGAITGTPAAGGPFHLTFRVTDAAQAVASKQITITINLPALPAVTFGGMPDTSPAARQPAVSVNLASPYATALTGTLTLTFASSVGGDDQTVQFSTGSRTLNFTVAAGATQATFTGGTPAVLTGTVAGTITIAAQFFSGGQNVTPSPTPTKTITVENAAPVIGTVTVQRSGNTITVVVQGYATSREMASGTYRFSATGGNTLQQSDIAVPLSNAFATWFAGTASHATGGQFRLTVPFTITGDPAAVNLVSVTLTNTRGNSAAVGP